MESQKGEHKILIVDDEPNIVMALEYAFKKSNFEVFIARDGEEALQIAESVLPDLVLLDIMMPNVDGYQTLKKIKENGQMQHTKVVFLSAKNKHTDIQKGLDMGADKYLTKPFTVKKIIEEVKEII
ncbi:MAG: response regulator [Bacteroidota bacterium]